MKDEIAVLTAIRKKIPAAEFDYNILMDVLHDFAKPRDYISRLLRQKRIIRVKKGLYVLGDWAGRLHSVERLANIIYGPSYISKEFALSYYGFIPEAVYLVTSVTLKRSKTFYTPVGEFAYTRLNKKQYPLGICQQITKGFPPVLYATPEKAILDTVPTSEFRTKKSLATHLIENLRIDETSLETLNTERLKSFVPAYSKTFVEHLIKIAEECKR